MSKESQSNALTQFGPLGAPLLGLLILIACVVSSLMSGGDLTAHRDALTTSITKTNGVLRDPEPTSKTEGGFELPDLASVATASTAGRRELWIGGASASMDLPIQFEIELQAPKIWPPGSGGEEMDRNDDGFISRLEWRNSGRTDQSFDAYDRNGDREISPEELGNPPKEDPFAKLDKNRSGVLEAGEINAQDMADWDTGIDDGGAPNGTVNRNEWNKRGKRKYNFGPPSDVMVARDPAKMEIQVSWTEPSLEKPAPDLAYHVFRKDPEGLAERTREFTRGPLRQFNEEVSAWSKRFRSWRSDPVNAAKANTRSKLELVYALEESDPKPVRPPDPTEWELLTAGSAISGTEYTDTRLQANRGYSYAIRALTGDDTLLVDGTVFEKAEGIDGRSSAAIEQTAHPVMVRVRIRMAKKGGQTIELTTWHNFGDDDAPDWKQVLVRLTLEKMGEAIGGKYSAAELKSRRAQYVGADGSPADDLTSGPINFATGWVFEAKQGTAFLLKGAIRRGEEFYLPKATRDPVQMGSADGMANPLEIRVVWAERGSAKFELTRWVRLNEAWYRTVLIQTVDKGSVIGAELTLDADELEIYDESGTRLNEGHRRQLPAGRINLKAGEFGGMDGRTLKVGEAAVDLFDVLYLEN